MNLVAQDIERAADAVRTANHSTMRDPIDGPQTYAVVGNLVELTSRLPQVLDFLARSLRRADPAEHFDDRGTDPQHALRTAHDVLQVAEDDLRQLVRRLADTHNHLSHLGRHITEDD